MNDYAESMNSVFSALTKSQGRLSETDAAGLLFLSPRGFRRVFLETQGKSYRSVRLHMRMQIAEKLVRETNESIESISQKLGYSRREKLDGPFRRHFGLTPAQYRKKFLVREK